MCLFYAEEMLNKASTFLAQRVSIAPLVIFRIAFGVLLLYSTLRTIQKGWVAELYIEPAYHFSFFSWLTPLEGIGMYIVFWIMAISALCIVLGLLYRVNTVLFLLLFLYVELLDKTYYLNHYYLVTLLTFWLTIVPAHHWYSIDAYIFKSIRSKSCANWHILIFKFQLSVVYFFAGLAKVNPDWLLRAQPMATWLPGKYSLPLIGKWMYLKETAFLFSWAGCFYDLFIWIFLWIKKTRAISYGFVLIFHILTGILFPRIGMFPYIMIVSTIIFFSPSWHERILFSLPSSKKWENEEPKPSAKTAGPWIALILGCYIIIQLCLPLRYLWYDGNLFWHEQGYRFSWRVMLMEKNGDTAIIVKHPKTNIQTEVDQDQYLTPFQQQQMRSQPDMILQFGGFVGGEFKDKYGYDPEVYVKSRLSLNGTRSQPFTNDTFDIYQMKDPMKQGWILPRQER